MRKIYTDTKKDVLPVMEALSYITDEWIAAGEFCDQTIMDLRDALSEYVNAEQRLYLIAFGLCFGCGIMGGIVGYLFALLQYGGR